MSPPSLPFAHLNLRRNPFGELSSEERCDLAVLLISDLVEFLCQQPENRLPVALQILGDKGFGKTTHLLALQAAFPASSYTWIPEGVSDHVAVHGEPVLIDEAQRLSLVQRNALWNLPKRLVLATHTDFAADLIRSGRQVMSISADRDTRPERVHMIVNARVAMFRRSSGAIPVIPFPMAEQLCDRYGSNIRGMLHALYDVFQSLRTIDDVHAV